MCRIAKTRLSLIIPIIILSVVKLGAIEVTLTGGGNYQRWGTRTDRHYYDQIYPSRWLDLDGFGFNAGGMVGLDFTPSAAAVRFGIQTGVRYYRANYVEMVNPGDSVITIEDGKLVFVPVEPYRIQSNKYMIPVTIRLAIPEGESFEWGMGMGPEVIVHDRQIDAGLRVKGEVGIRLLPKLWLTPEISALYITTSDILSNIQLDNEKFFALTLGLSYKI
jgi:hypothetical protein